MRNIDLYPTFARLALVGMVTVVAPPLLTSLKRYGFRTLPWRVVSVVIVSVVIVVGVVIVVIVVTFS